MTINPLYTAIKARLDELGVSANAASLAATNGANRDLISKLKAKNDLPDAANAEGLARVLGWSVADLVAKAGRRKPAAPTSGAEAGVVVPDPAALPLDLPVYGLVAGSAIGAWALDGIVEYVRRPPGVAAARNVYAVYVAGESMSPRHRPGDLLIVSPDRPARPGDDVVIQTRMYDGGPIVAYIKELVRRSPASVTVGQLNPPGTHEFLLPTVVAVHRVLTTRELLGG